MKFRALLVALAVAGAASAQTIDDSGFIEAREAFRKGDLNRLESAVSRIGNHPLAIYAENYRLRNLLARNDDSGIPAFLTTYDGTHTAERLRADWLRWLARRSTWNLVEAEYPRLLAPEAEVTCLFQQARW